MLATGCDLATLAQRCDALAAQLAAPPATIPQPFTSDPRP